MFALLDAMPAIYLSLYYGQKWTRAQDKNAKIKKKVKKKFAPDASQVVAK